MTLREFTNATELMAFYRELRARTQAWGATLPLPPTPSAPPTPSVSPAPVARLTPLQRIIAATAQEFCMDSAMLTSSSREQNVVAARQVVALLARELTNLSNRLIGKVLGHRDHSTVSASVASLACKMECDPMLAQRVRLLRDKLLEKDDERDEQDSERARDCGSCGQDAAAFGQVVGGGGNG
jgi:chromosomal replication initiation ATPase DnaA